MKKIFILLLTLTNFLSYAVGCQANNERLSDNSFPDVSKEVSEEISVENSEEASENVSEESSKEASEEVVVYNDTYVGEINKYYFLDMADPYAELEYKSINGVLASCGEGYTRFYALDSDPNLVIKTPLCSSKEMRYVRICYKTPFMSCAEFYVDRSDGVMMGEEAQAHFRWTWTPSDEFTSVILDVNQMCEENVVFTKLRFDPLTVTDVYVDVKYIAGFETKDEAEMFDYEAAKNKMVNGTDNVEWKNPQYVELEATPEDNYEGTLKITKNGDGTATISYVKDGEAVSYTVPDKVNYLSGGFGGTDDLGRKIEDSYATGIYGSKGEFYVGLFYFLWMGEHGDPGIYDMNKIVKEYGAAAKYLSCGAWGDVGQFHFWGEPLYGYYYSNDEWVIRKHMELLANANVDFLYFDVTNAIAYLHNAKKVMKVCHQLNEEGYDAPKVVFYTHTDSNRLVKEIYKEVYEANCFPDTWFYVDGKPVIVAYSDDNVDDFFTIRHPQWPNEPANKEASWPWMDFEWPQRVFTNDNGVGESINVSVAQHNGSIRFSSSALYGDSSNRGRSTNTKSENKNNVTSTSYKEGNNFQAQWDRVFDCIEMSKLDPKMSLTYVLVTGWNEWVAQRQQPLPNEEIFFVDTFNTEYSRDLEMTRGEYFDNYYMQLIYNIAKLKGSAPVIIQDSRKQINVTGEFSQWDDVAVTYTDPTGDCADRDAIGFGHTAYVNQTGRNDIAFAKVTNDTKNLYFYVETVGDISMFDMESSWMQLFINTNRNGSNGWYGYDYIVNYSAKDEFTTTVAKNTADGKYEFEPVGDVSYRVMGNKMMISVPLEYLGIADYKNINIEFKWADSTVKITNMEGFYELGDSAPLGRLNWIYRNK